MGERRKKQSEICTPFTGLCTFSVITKVHKGCPPLFQLLVSSLSGSFLAVWVSPSLLWCNWIWIRSRLFSGVIQTRACAIRVTSLNSGGKSSAESWGCACVDSKMLMAPFPPYFISCSCPFLHAGAAPPPVNLRLLMQNWPSHNITLSRLRPTTIDAIDVRAMGIYVPAVFLTWLLSSLSNLANNSGEDGMVASMYEVGGKVFGKPPPVRLDEKR